MQTFDVLVIGTGQSGSPLAFFTASQGLKTAVIERDQPGGTCVNYGCTPTKTLIASGQAAFDAQRSAGLGVINQDTRIDFQKIMARKNDIVKKWRGGLEKGLEETENLTYFQGDARFVSNKEVQVTHQNQQQTLKADRIFINTGSSALIPPVEGLDQIPFLDNTSILELQKLPDHLLIIGGNFIGLEFGQLFRRLGSKVTIFQSGERILPQEDEEVSAEMKGILEEEGIEIYENCRIEKVEKKGKEVVLTSSTGKKSSEISCSHLLLAVGRRPNTSTLGLENTDISYDEKGYIEVDDQCHTSVDGIYAMGDVTGAEPFTHTSYNDFVILRKHLFENRSASRKDRILTYTAFTDPQVGRVGITEKQANAARYKYKVARLDMNAVARGVESGHTRGFWKVVVDTDTEKILGATMMSDQGGELASTILMAMYGNISYSQIKDMMISHPTYTESLNNLFSQLD